MPARSPFPVLTAALLSALKKPDGRWLSRQLDVRFAKLALSRIGHQAPEPDLCVKERMLGLRPAYRHEILLAPPQEVANQHFMRYWEPYFTVIREPVFCRDLEPYTRYPELVLPRTHYIEALNETAAFPRIQKLWGDRLPLLQLLPEDREAGVKQLRQWGLGEGDWFVAIHCREAGFVHDRNHDFRNATIANFLPAIEDITARGGWVVRMGDATMTPLPSQPRVIDYALSPAKAEQLDVFLSASCRFMLGTSSGICMLASTFGVPCVFTNHAPLAVTLAYAPRDIGIPKLVRSRREQRALTFPEIFSSPAANFRFGEMFEEQGLDLVENTPEEILEASREMLERLEGRWTCTAEDEKLQQHFASLLRPGHYTYGSLTRVGRDFLRRHAELFN